MSSTNQFSSREKYNLFDKENIIIEKKKKRRKKFSFYMKVPNNIILIN